MQSSFAFRGRLGYVQEILTHPLNAHDTAGAFARCCRWVIGSRLLPWPMSVPFVNDTRLLVSRGMRAATENIYTGLSEFQDMSFLLHMLRPEDLFVDVGANVGIFTILASGAVGATSIALEPAPATFAHLRRNIAINGIEQLVGAHNIAVGDNAGTVKFTRSLDTLNHVVSDGAETDETIDVPLETVDAILGDRSPALIKIDVEGFEAHVLRGAAKTLKARSLLAVIIETNESGQRYGYSDATLHETLVAQGFILTAYDPLTRNLSEGNSSGRNSLYVRNRELVVDRLKAAPSFTVNGRSV